MAPTERFVRLTLPPLILASASPRRRELLSAAGIAFRIDVAGVEEIEGGGPPDQVAIVNATRKASAVAARQPGQIVLGSDTVVALNGLLYGKPADHDDALRMLQALSGQEHEVTTGVCLARDDRHFTFHETTGVRFRPAAEVDFESYLLRINPLDKAGAYSAQEDHGALIESIKGCRDNVIGLPVTRLLAELRRFIGGSAF